VPDVPLILFTTQVEEDITPHDDYEALMRNSALIGTAQLSGTLRKAGRKFEVVVGSIGEERPYEEIARLCSAYSVARRLKKLNVGIIGHVFRGMYDLENDKTKVKSSLGPNVIYVDLSHLLKQLEKVTSDEAAAVSGEMTGRFGMRGVLEEDLIKSCRLGLAIERLSERLRLDALCFLGQHHIEKEAGVPARIGASMMMERTGRMVASEGDLQGSSSCRLCTGLPATPRCRRSGGSTVRRTTPFFW
jgi:L-arabinose isomerase